MIKYYILTHFDKLFAFDLYIFRSMKSPNHHGSGSLYGLPFTSKLVTLVILNEKQSPKETRLKRLLV